MTGSRWPSASSSVVGVIGAPVGHSLSPLLHNTAFGVLGIDWVSVGFPVVAGAAAEALAGMRALGVRGLSVTMPHKTASAGAVDRCTPVAERLEAVNCVLWEGTTLVGDNTDGEGFLESLRRAAGFDPRGRRCVVAGTGGAARAVVLALASAGAAEVAVVGRAPERAAAAAALAGTHGRAGRAAEAADADLVVDATPVGMAGVAPDLAALVDPGLLHAGQVAADLVYHPAVTPWLAAAAAHGAVAIGGAGMLVHQAAAQIVRWTGYDAPVEAMWAAATGALENAR